jgi:protein-tyrosine phosphatase
LSAGAVGRIDVHSHLLPGIDDGCKSAEQSIECGRMLTGAGYTHVFCTPHVMPMYPHIHRANVVKWTQALQDQLRRAGSALTLMPGGELNLNPAVLEMSLEQVIPLGTGKYVLTDIWCDALPEFFEKCVRWLQKMELTVILAHPERCRAIQLQPQLADWFAELGVLLQGNLQCLNDPPTAPTRQVAERYLKDGRYFVLGSDTHNPQGLVERLSGLSKAIQMVGEEATNQLTIVNPQKLL